jgi:hypothetical protein
MRGIENSKAVKSPFKQDPRHNFCPFLLHLGHPALVDIVGPAHQVVLVAAHRHLQPGFADTDPNWIRIQSGQWIRIRIRNPDRDPGGQK